MKSFTSSLQIMIEKNHKIESLKLNYLDKNLILSLIQLVNLCNKRELNKALNILYKLINEI